MPAAPVRSPGSDQRGPAGDPHIGQAPGALATVQAFVNTLDIEQGTEDLSSPAALDRWLADAGLTDEPGTGSGTPAGRSGPARTAARPAPATSGPADLSLALDLREALRDVLRSHVRRADTDAAVRLAEISAAMQPRLTAAEDGSLRVVAGTGGSLGALTRVLLIAAEAETLGTWRRLKVCSADDCQWAFYDRSPTRSGCWCSMQICGARAKSRAYRSRAAKNASPRSR